MKQSLKTQDGTRPIQQSLWAGSRKDLVSRTPLPGSERAKMMTDTSGRKCLEIFEKFARPGLSAKTFPVLLIGQKGWYSKKRNLICKLKSTKHNRLYFQLQVSVPRTEGIGCGLLPTPRATEIIEHPSAQAKRLGDRTGTKLNNLSSGAKFGLLPTPAAQDSKNKTFPRSQQDRDTIPGAIMRQGQTGKTSQLNHRFVMEMMGFPPNWCDIYYEMAEIAIQKKRQRKKPKG